MSDISNVLRKVMLDISLGLDGTQEALDEITRLTAEVERLKAINALMEYAAFPTSEEAREAEEWIKANPGRSLSDYCSPGGLRVKQLTAEVERLRSLTVVQESLIRKSEAANEKLRAALRECEAELNAYYRMEYPSDHPYSQKKLAQAMASNPATVALKETSNDQA